MADIAVRRASGRWDEAAVLPAYKRLVIDEGHHLEDAAAAHLGQQVSRRGLERLFSRLERRGKGLLPALERKLAGGKDLYSAASLDLVRARLFPSLQTAREKSALLCDLLAEWMRGRSDSVVRLTDSFEEEPVWQAGLTVALDDLLAEVELLGDGLAFLAATDHRLNAADLALDAGQALEHGVLLLGVGGGHLRAPGGGAG